MPNMRSMLVTGAAVAAAAVGGAAIASASASATTSTTSTTSSSSSSSGAPAGARASIPAHGSAAHEDAEKPVTGTAAAKAKAAAVKYLGGGTAGEVTTDYSGNGYEVDVAKNGTTTEVHLDKSFAVRGGPNGKQGGPRAPASSGSSASYGPMVAN